MRQGVRRRRRAERASASPPCGPIGRDDLALLHQLTDGSLPTASGSTARGGPNRPATASIAAITDPPGPNVSMAPLCQVGRMPSAASRAVTPPSPNPPTLIAPGIGRQAVDVGERQPGVGDRRLARLHSQRQRAAPSAGARSATCRSRSWPTCPRTSPTSAWAGRDRRSAPARSRHRRGARSSGLGVQPGRNSGSQTSSSCSNTTSTVGRVRARRGRIDDVGGEPDPRVLLDRDLGEHVGRRHARDAEAVVDGEPGSVALPDTSRTPMSWERQ